MQVVIDIAYEMENLGIISTQMWFDPGHFSVTKVCE